MTQEEFIKKALLVPFVDKGRDYAGWDCYGLVYCHHRDVLGIYLPPFLDYGSTRDYETLHRVIETGKSDWQEAGVPHPGDIALFTLANKPVHMGVVINRFDMIHAEERIGTFVESFAGSVWRKRLEGFYRYRKTSWKRI